MGVGFDIAVDSCSVCPTCTGGTTPCPPPGEMYKLPAEAGWPGTAGVTMIEIAAMVAGCCCDVPLIVVTPAVTPVTKPLGLTAAMAELALCQTTVSWPSESPIASSELAAKI